VTYTVPREIASWRGWRPTLIGITEPVAVMIL
jgi:hypothetical protein